MKTGIRVFSALTALLGALAIYLSQTTIQPSILKNDVGGGAYPSLIGGLLIVFSVAMFIQSFRNPPEGEFHFGGLRALGYILLVAAYVALLKPLGFIVDSLWCMALMMFLMGCRKPGTIALTTVLFVGVIFAVFRYLFNVPIPQGILAGIL